MRTSQRGMTLLEIMIVLAILGLVMGLVIAPKILGHYRDAQHDLAELTVKKYADEDFPMWAVQHPATPCPANLMELSQAATPPIDPWGTAYKDYCAPSARIGFGAASFGRDRAEGTDDDIRSW